MTDPLSTQSDTKREQQWITLDRPQASALLRLHATTCQYEQGRMRWWLPAGLRVELSDDGEWSLWVVPTRRCGLPEVDDLV